MSSDNSILGTTKQLNRIAPEDTDFDLELITAINTVFADLHQLGVGSPAPFEISDESTTWDAFIGGVPGLNSVKTYMAQRVRLIFDPPTTGPAVAAVERQVKEFEWRLMEAAAQYRDSTPSITSFTPATLDAAVNPASLST